MSKEKKVSIWRIGRNIGLAILTITILWILYHHLWSWYEKALYPAPGQLVEVKGQRMHVYIEGEGEQTIVLLSGLGTAAPALDFEPLVKELAQDYRVVVVESFGYGWSDLTDEPRTVDNIIEELRMALQQANIEGPYILMPHSVSGIYSMYYANQYPEEIQAVIGIDPTLPQALDYFDVPAPNMASWMRMLAPAGITRLAGWVVPGEVLPIAEDGTYSQQQLKATQAITAWKGYNRNVVSEANRIGANVEETKELSFPVELPVLIFTTESKPADGMGRSMESFYESQLTHLDQGQLVILKGHHYLHWTRAQEMAVQVREFLKKER